MNAEIKTLIAKEFEKLDDACISQERRYHTMCGFIDALLAVQSINKFEATIFRAALVSWYDDDVCPDWENIQTEF